MSTLRITLPVSQASICAPLRRWPANGELATSSEMNPIMPDSPLRNDFANAFVR
ncbi:hypothetical protein D3C73_1356610 [compost metagenome]